jgi:hypothetical protein
MWVEIRSSNTVPTQNICGSTVLSLRLRLQHRLARISILSVGRALDRVFPSSPLKGIVVFRLEFENKSRSQFIS